MYSAEPYEYCEDNYACVFERADYVRETIGETVNWIKRSLAICIAAVLVGLGLAAMKGLL